MNRRRFALSSLATCVTAGLTADSVSKRRHGGHRSTPERIPFEFEKAVRLEMTSTPVIWQEQPFHLVTLNAATLVLDRDQDQLTARVAAAILTFDNVDYDISICIFDSDHLLLGVARTQCKVPRVWAGRFFSQSKNLHFDFGISRAWQRATSLQVSISDRAVLTPDAWQK